MTDWRRHGFSDPESALRSKYGYFHRHSLEQLGLIKDLCLIPSSSLSSAVFVCVQLVNHGFPNAAQYIEGLLRVVDKPQLQLLLKKLAIRHKAIQSLSFRRDVFSNQKLMTALYSDEKYTFIRSPTCSQDLMVVFTTLYNNFGMSNAVLVAILRQAGFSVLLLRDRSKYRYLKGLEGSNSDIEEVAKFVSRISSKEKIRRIFITGFSTGGYGSLFLSTLLSAELYIGFSIESDFSGGGPPERIAQQPKQLASEIDAKYLVSLSSRIRDLNDGISRHFYFGSRSRSDKMQVLPFQGISGCSIECVKDAGHETPLDLLDSGLLLSIFESAKQ